NSLRVVWTSDVDGDPNLFAHEAVPIADPPIVVEDEADRLTDEPDIDQYPQNSPAEENASRQGALPAPEKNR
ncbi:MAG: hypothetical protein L0154_01110, partial [Chloroflexi bacterium]|nr:hypothetical protein [Chloroflexota bacterium]